MFIRILACILLAMAPANVYAQGLNPFLEVLNDYNEIKPKQNPHWERSSETMKSRILDNKNKVIGELNDIILTPSGAIAFLNVELDRLQLGDVFLNYNEMAINASARSYALGYEDDQIEEFYPQLLANIETAAGDDNDRIGVDNLIGSDVTDESGRRIAKVEEVMFSDSGQRAEALLLRVNYKSVRGENVAIPFSSFEYIQDGSRFDVRITQEQADTVLQFASDM
ncbi:MAG: PRC-barrel domain-containing protein [Alphaproteobacteria bacterium]